MNSNSIPKVKKITHKHEKIEIMTRYLKDKPAEIVRVICSDCDMLFPELKRELQERENLTFELLGKKASVIFINPKVKWAIQYTYKTKEDLNTLIKKEKL